MFSFKIDKKGKKEIFNTKWWAPTKREWAPILLTDNKKYWAAQTSPEGLPWKPLSKSYKRWKSEHFGDQPILRASGKMQDTATIKTWGDRFIVKSTKVGPYHQFGTTKMAARPWMGVPDLSLNRLPGIAWKHILSK